jgi:hypothetical protein
MNLSHTAWWQVVGGHVLAANASDEPVAVTSSIPVQSCEVEATCIPALIRRDMASMEGSAGLVLTGTGTVDTTAEAGYSSGYVRQDSPQMVAEAANLTKLKEDYTYFFRQFSLAEYDWTEQNHDFAGQEADIQQPPSLDTIDKRAYYHVGDVTLQRPWIIGETTPEQLVIFIEGNLTFDDPDDAQQLLRVYPGSFLMFVVSGDIRITADVGNGADHANETPNLEGVFVADGVIHIQGLSPVQSDERFVGAGTFVGWGGVILDRDFADGGTGRAFNNTIPTELFIYRPDFAMNAPERLLSPRSIWQETT